MFLTSNALVALLVYTRLGAFSFCVYLNFSLPQRQHVRTFYRNFPLQDHSYSSMHAYNCSISDLCFLYLFVIGVFFILAQLLFIRYGVPHCLMKCLNDLIFLSPRFVFGSEPDIMRSLHFLIPVKSHHPSCLLTRGLVRLFQLKRANMHFPLEGTDS